MVYKLCHISKNMERLNKIEYEILYLASKGNTNFDKLWELITNKPEIIMIVKKLGKLDLLELKYDGEKIREFTISNLGHETLKSASYRRWFNSLGR